MVDTFAALADGNRLRIVDLLKAGPSPVTDIGSQLRLSQPLVSKHLRVLKEAGLVEVTPRARQRVYALRAAPMRQLHEWLEQYRKVWDERFEALDELIDELNDEEEAQDDRKETE